MKKIFASLIASAMVLAPVIVQAGETQYVNTAKANFDLLNLDFGLTDSELIEVGYNICSNYASGQTLRQLAPPQAKWRDYTVAMGYAAATHLCPAYKNRIPSYKMKYFLGQPNRY